MEMRLHKFLAAAGVASRRACEELIAAGRVRVNGKVVTEPGSRVIPGADIVEFEGRQVNHEARSVYLLLYKPANVISSAADPEGRPVATGLIPREYGRVYPVGRLDWDSEGALLMTNDGALTHLLMHPKHEVPRTYLAKVRGLLQNDDPRIQRLRDGVRLDDGYVTQPAELLKDSDTGIHTWFVVVLREGHNRQIRRMFEAIGTDVLKLKRISIGPVLLGDLQPGDFRRLSDEEVEALYEQAGGQRDVLSASRGRVESRKRAGRIELARTAAKAVAETRGTPPGVTPRKRGEGDSARPAPRREADANDRPARSGKSEGTSDRPPRAQRDDRPATSRRSSDSNDRPARPRKSEGTSDRPPRASRDDRPATSRRTSDSGDRPTRDRKPDATSDKPASSRRPAGPPAGRGGDRKPSGPPAGRGGDRRGGGPPSGTGRRGGSRGR